MPRHTLDIAVGGQRLNPTHVAPSSSSPPSPFLVGEWRVEPSLDQISRVDRVVKLEPRTMRLLVILAQRPGELVTPDELFASVWKDAVVTSSSLYESVAQLRKALGDHADKPLYIATVQRKGYRLVAPVSPLPTTVPAIPTRQATQEPARQAARPASRPLRTTASVLSWVPPWGPALLVLLVGLAFVAHNLVPTGGADALTADKATPRTESTSTQANRAPHVLWVDNKPSNNVREREALAALGVTFTLAESTEAALERFAASDHDLIISDMSRPGDPMAGYTLLKALRDRGHSTRFVIYTSACDNAQMHEARSRGALGCATQVSQLMQLSIAALETKR